MANQTNQEYEQLKKRNRRRLIGTLILVAVVFFILWKALSQKPAAPEPDGQVIIEHASDTQAYPPDSPPPLDVVPPIVSDLPATSDVIPPAETLPAIPPAETFPEVPPAQTLPAHSQPETKPAEPVLPETKPVKPTPETKPVKPTPETNPVKPTPETKPVKPAVKPEKRPTPQDILDGKAPGVTGQTKDKAGRYIIQVVAVADGNKAQEMKNRLAKMGIAANISKANTSKGEIHRVRVGPFDQQSEAQKTLGRLKSSDIDGIIVQQ